MKCATLDMVYMFDAWFANPIQNLMPFLTRTFNFISHSINQIFVDLTHSKGLSLLSSHGIQIVNWRKSNYIFISLAEELEHFVTISFVTEEFIWFHFVSKGCVMKSVVYRNSNVLVVGMWEDTTGIYTRETRTQIHRNTHTSTGKSGGSWS